MSDKIRKFLAKLSAKELERIAKVVGNIENDEVNNLDVKPIIGRKGFYRVRVGRVRIIYRFTTAGNEIVHITKRDEKTYKGF